MSQLRHSWDSRNTILPYLINKRMFNDTLSYEIDILHPTCPK